ncbi:hypothetical protein [Arcanobacterium hippocoleae]|uniref:Uncharacterized protein n=1 Tax=Arcanobacterium hippocoleae TaxID=149017 RepID=A0ABU1T218_9ACTO|nr:hypothetical protein [Arcanobacterium hippocoleae]MDR6938910.1 hypothetical protein [Arcanobacterium hippocoleae]
MESFRRYLILTPFADAAVVSRILELRKLHAAVVDTDSGVLVYRDLPPKKYDDWDISEILGGSDTGTSQADPKVAFAPDSPVIDFQNLEFTAESERDPVLVAKFLSQLSQYGVVLFTVELGDDVGGEAGVSGLVHATRVVAGQMQEELAPGLTLAVLDPKVEELLIAPPNLPPAANSDSTSAER